MIESRWIVGSHPLFQHFQEVYCRTLRGSGRKWFLQAKFDEWHSRHEKFDSSVFLLEPNVKETTGGLRDIHAVRWAAFIATGIPELSGLREFGIWTPSEYDKLRDAEDFILKLRNELHALSPRRNDVLNFEPQMEIARRLNYSSIEPLVPEEVLMRDYYRRAREIAKYCTRAFFLLMRREKSSLGTLVGSLRRRRIDRHYLTQDGVIFLDEKHRDRLGEDHSRMMELFARARQLGLRVSERTRDVIEKIVSTLDEEFSESPENHKNFMEILRGPKHVAQTLSDMHDCGLLSAYIPEFERVHCMVRVDYYHRYTVDEHLIKAVEIAERIRTSPPEDRSHAAEIAAQVKRYDLLNLSLLLHDIGKGYGKGHALLGGQIIQRIGLRMELEPEEIETLRFLVLSHLKISHVAQRRDLDDPEVALQLANEVGDMDRLNLLYVHSVCDLMAVSPAAMTDWKAQLYETCYRSTAAAITGAADGEDRSRTILSATCDRVWEYIEEQSQVNTDNESGTTLRRHLEEFLHNVPTRYLQSTHVEYIAKHFLMQQELDETTRILWSLDSGIGVSELTVCSADLPGAFATTCGALASKDISIVSAQIFSTLDGYAVNRFQVLDSHGKPLPEGFHIERLRADLNQVLLGKKEMKALVQPYRWDTTKGRSLRSRIPSEVRVNNDASRDSTILEIRTVDRPGLLYEIALLLDGFKLNIQRAMVMTEAYGVMDVFYVTDLEYNKIHDEHQVEKLTSALKRVIGESPIEARDGGN